MKKNKTYRKIIIGIVAAAAVLLLCCLFINRPDNTYDFPMVSQTLKWGSSKEDIIAETNARPEYLYHEINSTQVFYTDKKIETVFGTSSETRFFIITDFSVPVGLYGVQFTFADYSLEETEEAVFKQYKDIGHSVKWDASGSTNIRSHHVLFIWMMHSGTSYMIIIPNCQLILLQKNRNISLTKCAILIISL